MNLVPTEFLLYSTLFQQVAAKSLHTPASVLLAFYWVISVAEKIQGEPHRSPKAISVIFNIPFDGEDTTQTTYKDHRVRKIWESEFGKVGASGDISKFMHKLSSTLIQDDKLKHSPYYYATTQLYRAFFFKLLIESPDLTPFDCFLLMLIGYVRMLTNTKYKIDALINDVVRMMDSLDHSRPSASVPVIIAGADKLIAAHPIKQK